MSIKGGDAYSPPFSIQHQDTGGNTMNAEQAFNAAMNGAMYLANQVDGKGKFIYVRDSDGQPILGKYNMLRHAGCIWAMQTVYGICVIRRPEYVDSPQLAILGGSIARAASYLRSKCVTSNAPGLYVNCNKSAKLGGNALAILALGASTALLPTFQELIPLLESGLGRFMHVDTGLITSYKFDIATGANSDFESEYYPGEVALALAQLGKADQCYRLCYQTSVTRDEITPLQDHWMLQALEALAIINPSRKEWAIGYAKEIVFQILNNPVYMGKVCPMACRSEGLIAYYHLTDDADLKAQAWAKVGELLDEQIKFQNTTNPMLLGAFVDKTARIDFTQHNVSAFLRYYLETAEAE